MFTIPRAPSIAVIALLLIADATSGAPKPKETICHVPPGNPAAAVTLNLDPRAAQQHLNEHQGDHRGACGSIAGDRDADGVIDWLDNCLERSNSDQQDTDRDGFGNACDPDFDQDGVVDRDDEELLIEETMRRGEPTHAEIIRARDFDLDADGVVDGRDRKILRGFFGGPPGPRLDTDGDGRADAEDPCFQTPAGAAAVAPGCSALDIAQNPGALVDPVLEQIAEIVAPLRPRPAMRDVVTGLDLGVERLQEGARKTLAGDYCGGAAKLSEAEASLRQAFAAMDLVRRRAAEALARLDPAAGDVTEEELDAFGLEIGQGLIGAARSDSERAAESLGRVCSVARPLGLRGLVRKTADAEGRLELADERGAPALLVGLEEEVTITGELSEGAAAVVRGVDFGDGTGVASDVVCEASDTVVGIAPCLAVRFAPVQPMPPFASAPFLLHDPRGYAFFDVFLVEAGVRIAVERTCALPPPDDIPVEFPRYSVKVTLDYTDTDGLAHVEAPVAADLVHGETPAVLPSRIDPDLPALLHVRHFRQICTQAFTCGRKSETAAQDFPLLLRQRGSACTVSYASTLFAIDDQVANAKAFTAATSASPWPLAHFEAEGYAPCGFLDSCAPNVSTISGGQAFFLHNYDFYPIHPGVSVSGSIQGMVAALATGVTHAAGLKWPRARGTNSQGYEFQYSCTLPKVVRDVVNFCERLVTHDHTCIAWDTDDKCTAKSSHTTNVNAFYRMPFGQGDTSWNQGQGNLSPCGQGCPTPSTCPSATCNKPTHFGGYAYDMLAPCDDDIRAARAGRVLMSGVVESNDKQLSGGCAQCLLNGGTNCCPDQNHQCCSASFCAANALFIRHQDGTIGQYVHFPKDGIVPEPGDLVRRGELIGWIGVTGRSGGPHLHFAERSVWDQCCSHLMLFEATDPDDSDKLQCYEPQPGDPLRSNSKPWP